MTKGTHGTMKLHCSQHAYQSDKITRLIYSHWFIILSYYPKRTGIPLTKVCNALKSPYQHVSQSSHV